MCRKRKLDVVLVYRYDRFARSLYHLVNALEEFRSLGIDFISLHEGVDTSTPNGRLLFGIVASIAEFERVLIRERVKSGLAAALNGTAAGFYRYDPNRKPGADRDMELRDAIQRIVVEWPCCGRSRITQELRRQGWTINPKRVYRLMCNKRPDQSDRTSLNENLPENRHMPTLNHHRRGTSPPPVCHASCYACCQRQSSLPSGSLRYESSTTCVSSSPAQPQPIPYSLRIPSQLPKHSYYRNRDSMLSSGATYCGTACWFTTGP